MEQEKSYINKELMISKEEFEKSITNDFIGKDFTEQLEWAMLMVQNNFKQMRFAEYLPPVRSSHFDKAYLISATLNEEQKFFQPFTDLQVTPAIFPMLNIKFMNIQDTIILSKVKELDMLSKRHLEVRRRYAYEISTAFYKKDTESFYGTRNGYELGDGFFKLDRSNFRKIQLSDLPNPISLHPNYVVPRDAIKYLTPDEIYDNMKFISISYQVALSMYYEWCIYIKDRNGIGFIIPIEPCMLSEIYKTSLLKFDNKKRMLHFVREHYRRKKASINEDYSVFIHKYLRGEHKFEYRGFYTEIIPPKYDLNRIKTRKKFVDAMT